jgi:nicotinate-nucleotide pyrophosphorylase (carboxylating)
VPLDEDIVDRLVRSALAEDIGTGDITTESVVPKNVMVEARILAKASGVVAGVPVAIAVFKVLSADVRSRAGVEDGGRVRRGDIILELSGPAGPILSGERVALNFLQHLSGIATCTARFVEAVAGTGIRILDTRKTLPGLRILEKYAVTVGGGHNHRSGLYDMALIKDNHIKVAGSIAAAVKAVRARFPGYPVEVEAAALDQVDQAVQAGADRVMLDNMRPDQVRSAVHLISRRSEGEKRPRVEVSGNVTLENIGRLAMEGVDEISIGAITHSSAALDISLEVIEWSSGAEPSGVRP